MSRPGGPLAVDAPTATVKNPEWFRRGARVRVSPARQIVHRDIRERVLDSFSDVPQERRAIVLAGPPGAGKSYKSRQILGGEKWAVIDPDEFKLALLRQALNDGSFHAWIKPPEIAAREEAGEWFAPLEHASLVHEESSLLAKDVQRATLASGANVVIDAVLSNEDSARQMGQRLSAAGYKVRVVDVEVPLEVSRDSARTRHVEAYRSALDERARTSGVEPLGGRWVPSEYIESVFDRSTGRARSQANAEMLAKEFGNVTRCERYFTSAEEARRDPRRPVLEVDAMRSRVGGELRQTRLASSPSPIYGLPPASGRSTPSRGAGPEL